MQGVVQLGELHGDPQFFGPKFVEGMRHLLNEVDALLCRYMPDKSRVWVSMLKAFVDGLAD